MSEQECEQQSELTTYEVEKVEEAKLKAKYPGGVGARPGGHSAFLQKRLAKGQKFFDSGDYQMAKQKIGGGMNKQQPMKPAGAAVGAGGNTYATGDAIPTPETVPARKTSIIQPTKFNTNIS